MPLSVARNTEEERFLLASSRRVIAIDSDPRQLRQLAQLLRPVAPALTTSSTLPTGGEPWDLLVINYDSLAPADRQRLLEHGTRSIASSPVLLSSSSGSPDDLVPLFTNRAVTNLVARDGEGHDAQELIVTAQKILRRDIFGLDKYFGWGVEARTAVIRSSAQRAELLGLVDEYTRQLGINQRLAHLYGTVADELLTNALYNAPCDANGAPRFRHRSRTEVVELEAGEEVELRLCCDGRRLGISMTDPFGSLTPDRLLEYLAKCFQKGENQIDQKPGGAGLGLYFIFSALSHFVINIAPGKRTELIGLIHCGGTFRDFAARAKSFNVFTLS